MHAFFRLFDAAFDALARGYGRLVRTLAARVGGGAGRATSLLMAFAGWFVQRLPTGFIPSLDRAILIISLQLPPGASLARTDAVLQQATDMVLGTPGVKYSNALHRPQRRNLHVRHQRRPAVPRARRFRGAAPAWARPSTRSPRRCAASWRRSRKAQAFVFIPPPVRGMGAAAGFSMRLQDTMGMDPTEFARITQEFVAEANRTPGIANVFTTFSAATPQVFVDVDRDKAQMLKVPVDQHLRGHARVHGLGLRQRLQHVRPHLPRHGAGRRQTTAWTRRACRRSACAATEGQMVPLGSLVTFNARSSAPSGCRATTCFPRRRSTARRGRASARARRCEIMRELWREKLPQGVTFEWTDLSYQEAKVGRTGYYIFVLSVIFVFLALSAQYESWSLPLAIMLIVPMCLFSAAVRRVAARARDQHPHPDRLRRADRAWRPRTRS